MGNQKLTPLAEGGLFTALTVVMAMVAVYVPLVGVVAAVLWPLPVLVLVLRHGLRLGFMLVAVSGVLMAVLIEPTLSLRLVSAFAPLGLVLGYGYRAKWSAVRIFCSALVMAIFSEMLSLSILFYISGVNPFAAQLEAMQQSFQLSIDMYRQMNVNEFKIAEAEGQFKQAMQLVSQLFPIVVVMMGILDTVINYFFAGKVLKRLGYQVPQLPAFAEWRLPAVCLYVFGFSLVGLYWGSSREIQWLYTLSLNANVLATTAGLVQGLSLVWCLMAHYRLPFMLRCILVTMIIFFAVVAQILAFVGLFDMVFDYRRRFRSQNGSDER